MSAFKGRGRAGVSFRLQRKRRGRRPACQSHQHTTIPNCLSLRGRGGGRAGVSVRPQIQRKWAAAGFVRLVNTRPAPSVCLSQEEEEGGAASPSSEEEGGGRVVRLVNTRPAELADGQVEGGAVGEGERADAHEHVAHQPARRSVVEQRDVEPAPRARALGFQGCGV